MGIVFRYPRTLKNVSVAISTPEKLVSITSRAVIMIPKSADLSVQIPMHPPARA